MQCSAPVSKEKVGGSEGEARRGEVSIGRSECAHDTTRDCLAQQAGRQAAGALRFLRVVRPAAIVRACAPACVRALWLRLRCALCRSVTVLTGWSMAVCIPST